MSRQQLRIATYNIHKGFNSGNREFLLHEIRHAIRSLDADMMLLQEVVGHQLSYAGHHCDTSSQFEFLADQLWPHHAYGKNAIIEAGHHGNAILSKHPFQHWQNTDISHHAFSQRGVLLGQTAMGIYVINTHFGLLAMERKRQLRQLLALIDLQVPHDAPLAIAGDFNDWNRQLDKRFKAAGFREALSDSCGKPARTFPAVLPLFKMDRIYYRNLELVEAHALSGKPWRQLSDHCALSAVFSL